VVAAAWRQTNDAELLANMVGRTRDPLQATEAPLIWTLPPVTATLEVPVLVNVTVHSLLCAVDAAGPALHEVTCADTCAELVNDPNRPRPNPAMAMAAMRVIAMRMTVARTGEMAFLFPLYTIFIVVVASQQFCL
jgi:predicted nucleic acid-binding Zn ribbon protein